MTRKRGVFDLESDNLLFRGTVIWCIVIKDIDTGEVFKFPPNKIRQGLEVLSSFKMIIGHNICGFDVPFIHKFYPKWPHGKLRDTLCMSKLFNPERWQGHRLETYGEQFGRYKPVHEDWSKFTPEMMHRCSEDVEINHMTYDYLVNKYARGWDWMDALELEQEFSTDQAYQEVAGVDIDQELAYELVDKIDKEVFEMDPILLSRMPKRLVKVNQGKEVKKVFNKDGSYHANVKKWFGENLCDN